MRGRAGFKGAYDVIHPNDHVNASQSTNDSYPTGRPSLPPYAGIQKLLIALAEVALCFRSQGQRIRPYPEKSAAHNYKMPCP